MTRRGVYALGESSVCILVDDVLTTGATLAAAERTLEDAGHDVLGATVLAATPPPAHEAEPGAAPAPAHLRGN
jgi:adenine/guanine phosphoribosyltransferase-like PRPP-binding protein